MFAPTADIYSNLQSAAAQVGPTSHPPGVNLVSPTQQHQAIDPIFFTMDNAQLGRNTGVAASFSSAAGPSGSNEGSVQNGGNQQFDGSYGGIGDWYNQYGA